MIKFIMHRRNRKILGIIITRGNLNYLMDDKPIHFNAEEMGIPEINVKEIAIFYFETEEEAKKRFYELGLITEKTIIHDTDKTTKPQ